MQQTILGQSPVEVARHKITFQSSSVKKWNYPNFGIPPGNATSGIFTGNYSFHTNMEHSPWWMVDLEAAFPISLIQIFNRQKFENRNRNIDILLSLDMAEWLTVHSNSELFGGVYDNNPLVCRLNGLNARFVRVQCRDYTMLHFDQIEVYANA